MSRFEQPSEDNGFLAPHVAILRHSLRHWTRRELVDPHMSDEEAARFLFHAPFVVVSHDTQPEPVFNYANRTALNLFAMDWEEFTALPSRLSAEEVKREEREESLRKVAEQGYIDRYQAVRIGRHGRRFRIEDAVVWNLLDANGAPYGQAALFERWTYL
ncbi:MEKHLA domain-containing protein [Methylococcus sp. EFPC2]|uniref:MEKHLA domain-containing protein n=1 Tax=Methylococcus sp. EFPC2 TaxID=2812648 RepID=UPI00196765DC|nr:MEKHLA domain-containing protein [Methylococcus sp. EFPC2]QSA97203.1 MEKHLA domain-containing protein [Methylococcus sp. EFPC2]